MTFAKELLVLVFKFFLETICVGRNSYRNRVTANVVICYMEGTFNCCFFFVILNLVVKSQNEV